MKKKIVRLKSKNPKDTDSLFVGGEFYSDDEWISDQRTLTTEGLYFLNGGRACLTVIAHFLQTQGIHDILLPAYLCPTILDVLEAAGLQYSFYRVHEDLTIDVRDLQRKAAGQQVVYFINYFGFPQPQPVQQCLQALQQQGRLLVEDNAQAGFMEHTLGDLTFNSMRKLCPQDGGYLQTRFDLSSIIAQYAGRLNRRLPVIRAYRNKLRAYLLEGTGNFEELEELFRLSEQYYLNDEVIVGDEQERRQIEHMDWEGIRQKRRENYRFLLEHLSGIPNIQPIFPSLPPEVMPMGLPVYIQGGARDRVYQELGNASIGLVIHWEELLHDPRTNGNSTVVDMASRMLTLNCDQRTDSAQMIYMVNQLLQISGGK